MSGVNKVILIGNLGADPEVRYFPSGDGVANLSVATSETWKDRNSGEPQERTEWHRVVIRGKLAEVVKNYLHKGSKVYLEGKLHTRKWQDQSGQDRYTTEIVVDINGNMQLLGGRPSGDDSQRAPREPMQRPQQAPQQQSRPAPQQQPAPQPAQDYDSFDDDIPF